MFCIEAIKVRDDQGVGKVGVSATFLLSSVLRILGIFSFTEFPLSPPGSSLLV